MMCYFLCDGDITEDINRIREGVGYGGVRLCSPYIALRIFFELAVDNMASGWRRPAFIANFIAVSVIWVRRGRQKILNIYTANTAYKDIYQEYG